LNELKIVISHFAMQYPSSTRWTMEWSKC